MIPTTIHDKSIHSTTDWPLAATADLQQRQAAAYDDGALQAAACVQPWVGIHNSLHRNHSASAAGRKSFMVCALGQHQRQAAAYDAGALQAAAHVQPRVGIYKSLHGQILFMAACKEADHLAVHGNTHACNSRSHPRIGRG